MSDGITTGLQHALLALGYLIGLLPVVVVAALLVALAVTSWPRITHRVRVHRLRAQARRAGRV